MAFEPGDVVILKSGGHSMTVVSASDDEITCLWINEGGELFRETIPAVALESIYGHYSDGGEEENKENDEDEEDNDEENDEDEEDEDDDEEEDDEHAEEKKTRKKRP